MWFSWLYIFISRIHRALCLDLYYDYVSIACVCWPFVGQFYLYQGDFIFDVVDLVGMTEVSTVLRPELYDCCKAEPSERP